MTKEKPLDGKAIPFPTSADHPVTPAPSEVPKSRSGRHSHPAKETALDEGLDESFPASDPVSIGTQRIKPRH